MDVISDFLILVITHQNFNSNEKEDFKGFYMDVGLGAHIHCAG